MGGRGSSSASAASAVESGGASPNADRRKKHLAGELGAKVTKNDEFMMNTVFPGMNYNKVPALQVQHLRIRRPGVQGRRAHQRHGLSRQHQGVPRIRGVIPAIEASGLEPARAVLTSSRDTHVCQFRHAPVA